MIYILMKDGVAVTAILDEKKAYALLDLILTKPKNKLHNFYIDPLVILDTLF